MAINKTLLLLVAFTCLIQSASASIMLEKWFDLFKDATFDNFLKLLIWQVFSTIGPIAAGLVMPVVADVWAGMSEDEKYGSAAFGVTGE